MSRFFKDNSPAKKAKPEQTSDGAGSGGFKTVGEVYPGLVCPLDQKVLLKKYTKTGRPWIVCSGNVQNDPDSCHFSANLFGRDRVKEGDKSKIACQICDVPAEFTPSIGEPTGEKNPLTGKPGLTSTMTDSAWQHLISDGEIAPFPVEDAQLAESHFDRYVQDQ